MAKPNLVIETQEQLDALLDYHPYFRDRPNFSQQYHNSQLYILIKTAQAKGRLQNTTYHELAQRFNINEGTIYQWLTNRGQPRLIRSLIIHETARRQHESHIPQEAKSHRIDPATTYQIFKHLQTHTPPYTPEHLANTIATLYHTQNQPTTIFFAELNPYHQTGPYWLRNIAKAIKSHRTEIEHLLNQHLGLANNPNLALRLAVVNHTLYLWHQNTDPDRWLNLYAHEHFYLDNLTTKHTLMNNTRRHLNVTDPRLCQLVHQLTNNPGKPTGPREILPDLTRLRPYLLGASLHLLLDVTNQTLQDIQSHIQRIGSDFTGTGQSGIHNPRFPIGQQLDEFRARAYAIIASDGHIHNPSRALTYLDKDPKRIEYVKSLFRTALGELHTKEDIRPNNVTRLIITVIAGRILEKWGIPVGDKIIQQYSLHPRIQHGTPRVKRAYLEELTPEDGGFYSDDVSGWFEWKRAVILDAGPKNKGYNFQPLISLKHKNFIENQGRIQTTTIRDEPPRKEIILKWTRLQLLAKDAKITKIKQTAEELIQVIQQNPCHLFESEILLCESLDISISKTPKEIHLHETGRVSTIWKAKTHLQEDAVRWAILAPPSSGAKREAVLKWLNTRREFQDIHSQLEDEGLLH